MTIMTKRATEQLALQGGMKAVSSIEGKGKPKIGIDEFMSVAERFGLSEQAMASIRQTLEGEDWGAGPFLANYYSGLPESKVAAFERTAQELFESPYAVGVSSGTGALHSAFVAAGVRPGTEVICPAIGFYATPAAVVLAGGMPVFCDVDESLTMDPDALAPLINERTVALAPTHVMGNVCRMDKIMEVAESHGLRVVEDCAQACGGRFDGRLVGTIGDFGCFSIAAYKIVGGGEGGLVLTKTERDWDGVNALAEGGGLWRPERFAKPRYEGELLVGGNYRMSELEASVDVVQLGKVESTVGRFRRVHQQIRSLLHRFAEIMPQGRPDPQGDIGYVLRFYPDTVDLAMAISEALNAEGIAAGTRGDSKAYDWHIYYDMHPVTANRGCACHRGDAPRSYQKGACPTADDLFARMVTVNLNQWYTENDCERIATGINKVLSAFCTPSADGAAW